MKTLSCTYESIVFIIRIFCFCDIFKCIEGSMNNETKDCILRLMTDFYRNQKDIPLVIHFHVSFILKMSIGCFEKPCFPPYLV